MLSRLFRLIAATFFWEDPRRILEALKKVFGFEIGFGPSLGGINSSVPMDVIGIEVFVQATGAEPTAGDQSKGHSVPATEAAENGNGKNVGGSRIFNLLVLDDEFACLTVMQGYLKKMPWPVKINLAKNGEEARSILAAEKIDIIFSDICMAEEDGFEFLEELREDPKHETTPVVLFTAIPEHVGKKRGMMVGSDAYLEKPIELDKLEKVMRQMIPRIK